MDSDLVKFAKFIPDSEAASQALLEAHSLVDATRPRPELEAATEDQPPAAPVATRQFSYQSGQ